VNGQRLVRETGRPLATPAKAAGKLGPISSVFMAPVFQPL
jgi:hypothetical protein